MSVSKHKILSFDLNVLTQVGLTELHVTICSELQVLITLLLSICEQMYSDLKY